MSISQQFVDRCTSGSSWRQFQLLVSVSFGGQNPWKTLALLSLFVSWTQILLSKKAQNIHEWWSTHTHCGWKGKNAKHMLNFWTLKLYSLNRHKSDGALPEVAWDPGPGSQKVQKIMSGCHSSTPILDHPNPGASDPDAPVRPPNDKLNYPSQVYMT